MAVSLQRAGMWKRISAFLFDAILLGILAVLFAFLLSSALGYDRYVDTLNRCYEAYGEQYGVDFQTSLSQYDSMTDEEKQQLEEAYRAVGQDEEAAYAYQMTIRLTILMVSLGILLACLIWEVLIPALLKDGQTLGKKIFSLGVMRSDGVRLGGVQLFVRSILGKYTVEIMIPVLVAMMLYFGSTGLPGTLLILGLALVNGCLFLFTYAHTPIHDLLAGTVVVDLPSQRIFPTREDMIAFKERMAAEKAAEKTF
ncbi:MAG: RDD family protein [Candidatus Limiplasma sp.]|nr:RDD family protein [Clostridiales bacterium]MDY3244245.1 RDD family protein [Candidatus Limiplasma sp.]MDY4062546.1 RDD family protein [Candidatus Limiplasma sp.]